MTTRRDDPDGTLWRLAVDGFHCILIADVRKLNPAFGTDPNINRSSILQVWKEVADVYELFLVGHCGRALPSNTLSTTAHMTNESLEMNILDILADKILRSDSDVPLDVIFTYLTVALISLDAFCCIFEVSHMKIVRFLYLRLIASSFDQCHFPSIEISE